VPPATPIVVVLEKHPAGAGAINRGATSIGRAAVEAGPFAAIGDALSFYPPALLALKPLQLREGTRLGRSSAGGEGQPQPPRCSPVGDENGVRIP
jgi:hypothetical protein